jgi:hypothetical protein
VLQGNMAFATGEFFYVCHYPGHLGYSLCLRSLHAAVTWDGSLRGNHSLIAIDVAAMRVRSDAMQKCALCARTLAHARRISDGTSHSHRHARKRRTMLRQRLHAMCPSARVVACA